MANHFIGRLTVEDKQLSKQQYEFGRAGLKQQWSIIAVKLSLVIILLFSVFQCVISESSVLRMQHMALVLTVAFLYANVAQFKYELKQMFQPPIEPVGYPFAILGTVLYTASFFI